MNKNQEEGAWLHGWSRLFESHKETPLTNDDWKNQKASFIVNDFPNKTEEIIRF